jgi:hypothetical protein
VVRRRSVRQLQQQNKRQRSNLHKGSKNEWKKLIDWSLTTSEKINEDAASWQICEPKTTRLKKGKKRSTAEPKPLQSHNDPFIYAYELPSDIDDFVMAVSHANYLML